MIPEISEGYERGRERGAVRLREWVNKMDRLSAILSHINSVRLTERGKEWKDFRLETEQMRLAPWQYA